MNNAIRTVLVTGALCGALFGGQAAATPLVVPNAQAGTEGNDANFGPFFDSSVRYQQVYSASQFSPTGPLSITQIAFRPDGAVNDANLNIVPTSVRIDLSTTSRAPATLSTVFADNVGADNATVFNSFVFTVPITGPAGGPKDFTFVFAISPFIYDPSLGNLLLDFRTVAPQVGISAPFDAQSGSPFTAHVDASGVGSSTGSILSTGLVTQFQVTPVAPAPEPATLALLALGLAGFGWSRRRK